MAKVIKKILTYGFAEALAKGLNWLIMLLLPIMLTVEEYSKISIIVAVQAFLNLFILGGMDKLVLKKSRQGDSNSATLTNGIVFLCLSALVALILLSIPYIVNRSSVYGIDYLVVPILCFSMLLFSINRINISLFRVRGDSKSYLANRFLYQICLFSAIVIFGYYLKNYHIYPLALLIASATVFLYEKRKGVYRYVTNRVIRVRIVKIVSLFSLPFVIHSVSKNLLMYFDRYLIRGVLGEIDLGIYTFAYTISQSLSFIYFALNIYFEPEYYRGTDEKPLNKYLLFSHLISIVAIAIIIFAFPFIVSQFYEQRYFDSYNYLPALLASSFLNSFYIAFTAVLVKKNMNRYLPVATIAGSVINIALNIILIPIIGVKGAVYANYFSYFVLIVLMYFLCRPRSNDFRMLLSTGMVISVGLVFVKSSLTLYVLLVAGMFYGGYFLTRAIIRRT